MYLSLVSGISTGAFFNSMTLVASPCSERVYFASFCLFIFYFEIFCKQLSLISFDRLPLNLSDNKNCFHSLRLHSAVIKCKCIKILLHFLILLFTQPQKLDRIPLIRRRGDNCKFKLTNECSMKVFSIGFWLAETR